MLVLEKMMAQDVSATVAIYNCMRACSRAYLHSNGTCAATRARTSYSVSLCVHVRVRTCVRARARARVCMLL